MCGTALSSSEKTCFPRALFFILLFIFIGCSKEDDDLPEIQDEFYKDALVSANNDLLNRTWAIFQVGFEGKSADVSVNYQECGRDFFQFSPNATYTEYIFTSSYNCEKEILNLNWRLEKGILSLENSLGQTEEMVILQLNSDKLVFKMRVDIDEDSELEILTFMARPYSPPNDLDLYSHTFGSETMHDSNKIEFTWLPYDGFYKFSRYEIYRSNSGCSKATAELLVTIENPSENSFIDLDPPAVEEICYFFRIYNEKGLLGESEIVPFFTEYLLPADIEFQNVKVLNNSVELKWEPYEGNYFSHYEIRVRNFTGGSGFGYQEFPVKIIEDKDITSFLDENPPRLKNPVYAIYAYNIFGNVNGPASAVRGWELNWSHPEVLNFESVQFVSVDKNKPEILLYGQVTYGQNNLIRYNYQNNQVSATAVNLPDLATNVNMRLYHTENGEELFFPQGNALAVYNATDLTYKYMLELKDLTSFDDFVYLGNNIFSLTDRNTIYTYKRTNANIELISKKDHFSRHFSFGNYHLIPLKNGEILVGHYQEELSYKFSIGATGEINGGELIDIPVKSLEQKKTIYSPEKNYIINLLENKLYSTHTYNFQTSFETPYFPSGINRDGNLILGSNNNPQEYFSYSGIHERKAGIYNLTTGKLTTIQTKGYPHLLFENHLGQIISISSEFQRESLEKTLPKADIFIEVVK